MKVKSFYWKDSHQCAILVDELGYEYDLWHGAFVNVRRFGEKAAQNGRVYGIGKNGFDLFVSGRRVFIAYSDISVMWNIH